MGANVTVRLEIDAEMPDGAPEHVVRIVTENGRLLKFDTHCFEEKHLRGNPDDGDDWAAAFPPSRCTVLVDQNPDDVTADR